MKLVAIKSFTYAGARIAPGDVFDSKTERDGKLLIGIKNAREVENRPEAKLAEPPKSLVSSASEKPAAKPETKPDEDKTPEGEGEGDEEKSESKDEEKEDKSKKQEAVMTPEPVATPAKRTYTRKS